jgi:hypothetical protein
MYASIGQRVSESVHLSQVFSDADKIRDSDRFQGMLKGLTIQPAECYDNKFSDDVSVSFNLKMFFLNIRQNFRKKYFQNFYFDLRLS